MILIISTLPIFNFFNQLDLLDLPMRPPYLWTRSLIKINLYPDSPHKIYFYCHPSK